MKRPFDSIKEIFSDSLTRSREDLKAMFEQAHSFMIWIVGFSIGGLSLIVANVSKIDQNICHSCIKCILILLTTSIISGIIYRLSIIRYQAKFRDAMFYIEGSFSDKQIIPTTRNLSNENDIKEIVKFIKEDFDEDLFHVIDIYESADAEHKMQMLSDIKIHYEKSGQWAKKSFDNGINFAKDVYQKAFGLSTDKVNKLFNDYSSRQLRIWMLIASISFYLSCLTFIAVIIILCASY